MAKDRVRTALERRHLKFISPLEARFARDYRAVMQDLRESIRTSGRSPFNLKKWGDKAVEAMRPAYRAAILAGGRDFIENTLSVRGKLSPLKSKAAKKRSVGVVVSLESQFEDRLRETITTTYEGLASILAEAVTDKLDPDEVGDLIDEEWDDILGFRTDAIALTETNGAVNSVRDYLLLELVELQSWVNARDERVRPTHVIYGDAGKKPVGFDWSQLVPDAGYTLRFPCDPECHEPSEVINCRCFVVPEGELELNPADLKDYLADFEMDPEDLLRSEDQEPVYVTNAYTGKTVKHADHDQSSHGNRVAQEAPGGRGGAGVITTGLNDEDYRGGQFLPSGDIPKKERSRRERIMGERNERQIEPSGKGGLRAAPPRGGLRPLMDVFVGDPTAPAIRNLPSTDPVLVAAWDAGARWRNVADWTADHGKFYDVDGNEVAIKKGWEEQPRDENGRWGEGGGSIAAGSGAAREGRDRRVDGDGAHLTEGGPGTRVPEGSTSVEPMVYSVPGGGTVYRPGAALPKWLMAPKEPPNPHETDDEGRLRRRRNEVRDEFARVHDERIQSIKWVQPKRARGEEMVEVDVAKLDESWKGEPSYRIDEKGSNAIGNRLSSFGEWLHNNPTTAVETPEVGLNQNGKISFTNGRHRFAYLRDRGVRTIFVSVPKSEARKVRAIAGVEPQKKGVLKGDLPGHEFRGNQWTTGAAAMEGNSDLNALGKSKAKELQALLDEADEGLPQEAQDAIVGFVGHGPKAREYAEQTGGFGVMAERRLEDAMSADPSPEGIVVRDQLEAAFAPVRERLREMLGKDEVILYRAQRPVDPNAPDRNVLSWSMSREFVRDYSGASRSAKVYSDEETEALVRDGEAKGEVEIGNHVLRRSPIDGRYWDIYQKADDYGGEEHITDVEGIRHYIEMENDDAKERNADNAKRLEKVRRASIPLDDVVWATQRANQWELIVRNRTGKKAADGFVLKGDVEGHPFRGNQWTGGQGGGDEKIGGISRSEVEAAVRHRVAEEWFRSGEVIDSRGKDLSDPENIAWADANPEEFRGMVDRWREESLKSSHDDWANWGSGRINDIADSIARGEMPSANRQDQSSSGFSDDASRFEAAWSMMRVLSDPDGPVDDGPLYRGMVIDPARRSLPEVGGVIEDPIMSFTTSEGVGNGFARGTMTGTISGTHGEGGRQGVLIKTEGPVHVLYPAGKMRDHKMGDIGEAEMLSGGKFEVTKVETREDGVKVYTVRQVEQTPRPADPWKLKGEPPKSLRSKWKDREERKGREKRQAMIDALHDAEDTGRKLTPELEAFKREYLAGLGLKTIKGDFEGHPFRGNQWTEGTTHGSESADRAAKNSMATARLMDNILFAYAKDNAYFESDAFNGMTEDGYRADADLSTKLYEVHERQREDMVRLGIEFKDMDPRSAWGATAPGGPMDYEDARSNMMSATKLLDEVIASVEAAPQEVRDLLQKLPLRIEYTASAPTEVINGQTFTRGAAVGYTTINGEPHDLTLYLYRSTSVQPNAVPHEIGHVFTDALHGLQMGERRSNVARELMSAYKHEGGITEYADSFKNSTRIVTAGIGVGPNESFAEMEAAFTRLRQIEGGGDPMSFALRMATNRLPPREIIPGLIPKPFPRTALAWLQATQRGGDNPAPKDMKSWSKSDFKAAWNWDRLGALASGKPDPGPWDGERSETALREKWMFLF